MRQLLNIFGVKTIMLWVLGFVAFLVPTGLELLLNVPPEQSDPYLVYTFQALFWVTVPCFLIGLMALVYDVITASAWLAARLRKLRNPKTS